MWAHRTRTFIAPRTLQSDHPGLQLVGLYVPTSLDREAPDRSQLCDILQMTRPDIILVGLSTPDQEVWADAMANSTRHGVFVCVGEALNITLAEPVPVPVWANASHVYRPWRFWL
ncbi:MAG: WecB/TagA/CpsF family glycosyltransferase [Pseudomonadota bacterium]